jgi:hypothetical protein
VPKAQNASKLLLETGLGLRHISGARAHGMWTYEPRQGRKAATVVCSASAVVTLAFFVVPLSKDLLWERNALERLS